MKRSLPLLTATAVALVVLTGLPVAASDNDNATALAAELRACAGLTNALERLVCFDELVASLPTVKGATEPAIVAEVSVSQNEQEEITPAVTAESDAAIAERLAAAERRAAEAEQRLAAQRAAEAERAQAEAEAAELARRTQPPSEKTYYLVTEIWQSPRGLQRFRLDNGQAWEQISSGDRVVLREGERYYIQPGRFGGFSLGSDSFNRRMRVQLLD